MLYKADTNVSDSIMLCNFGIELLPVKLCFESWLFYVKSVLLYCMAGTHLMCSIGSSNNSSKN